MADCGQNITHEENGIITSPGYPAPYPPFRQICNWYINVKANHRILLFFEFFLIEGDPASRGCPGAVVRIWKDLASPPIELCGEGLTNDTRQFISSTEMLRLSFITADKAVGSGGFKATWTQIKDPSPSSAISLNSTLAPSGGGGGGTSSPPSPAAVACNTNPPVIATGNTNNPAHHLQQHEFRCASNHYCIPAKLKCNGIHNCGKYDDSDEANCVKSHEMVSDFLFTGLIAAASLFICALLCSVCRRRRRSKRKRASISSINANGAPGAGGGSASIMHTGNSMIHCNADGSVNGPSLTRRASSCSSMDFNPVTYCTGGHAASSDAPLLPTSLTVNCPPPPPPPVPVSSNLISVSSSSSLAGQHLTPGVHCGTDANLSTSVNQVMDSTLDSLDGQMYSHTLPHTHSHHQVRHPVYHHQQSQSQSHHHHHHTLHSHSHVHSHLHSHLQDASEEHSLHSLSGGNLLMSIDTESSSPSPPTSNTTVIAMSTKTQPQPLLSSHSLPFVGSVHDVPPGIFDLPVTHGVTPPPPPSLQRLQLSGSTGPSLSTCSQYQSHPRIESLICLAPDNTAAGSVLPSDMNDGHGTGHTPGSLTHATTTYIPADSL